MTTNNFRMNGRVLPVFIIIALSYVLYLQTFGHHWAVDDYSVIVKNPDIRSLKAFWADGYPGRPVRELTYLLDYSLFGLNPSWWHFQQIFWHGLNGILLWFLVRRLAGGAAAWAAAILFIVHPLQVEVVANLANRKDSLSLAFSLMAMLTHVKFLQDDRRYRRLLLSLVLYVLACHSKQNALLLPVAFLAYEYVFLESEKRFLLARPKVLGIAAFATGIVGVATFFMLDGITRHRERIESFLVDMNLTPPFLEADYFQMVLKGWSFMGRRVVWPTELSPEYVFAAPVSWIDSWVISSLLIVFFMVIGLIWSRKRSAAVFFALTWFWVFFIPIANVWPINYFAADRYYYAPLSALCIFGGLIFQAFFRKRKELSVLSLIVVSIALALITLKQSRIWQSSEAVWNHAVKVNPMSATATSNMGRVAWTNGDYREAISWYRKAAKINPSRPEPMYRLGWAYEKLGNRHMAVYFYEQFLQRVPYSSSRRHHEIAKKVKLHLKAKYGIVF